MLTIDVVAILCTTLMSGNELAVSLFINPAMERLEGTSRTHLAGLLARSLGGAMPFWYIASLVLLCLEAWLHRSNQSFHLLLSAAILMLAIIGFTLALLVPINNRIARLSPGSAGTDWYAIQRRWDTLHRFRIVALIATSACLVAGLLH